MTPVASHVGLGIRGIGIDLDQMTPVANTTNQEQEKNLQALNVKAGV